MFEVAYGKLDLAAENEAVIVLDGSASAREQRRTIIETARYVLDTLPAAVRRSLYLLGSNNRFDTSLFPQQVNQWFEANVSRASLLRPIINQIGTRTNARLIVIGCGQIFDLWDWEDDDLLTQLLLIRVGESLNPGLERVTELSHDEQGAIEEELLKTSIPTSVIITGPGFMPLTWDNESFQVRPGELGYELAAEGALDLSVRIRYLNRNGIRPNCTLQFSSGRTTVAKLDSTEAIRFSEPLLGRLTESEYAIFQRAKRRMDFSCPYCNDEHSWDTTTCRNRDRSRIRGRPIFPTIAEKGAGFVIVRETKNGAEVYQYPSAVLRLGVNRVAVHQRGLRWAAIVEMRDAEGKWETVEGEKLLPYHPVANDCYVCIA